MTDMSVQEEVSLDRLIEMASSIRANFVWIMDARRFDWLRLHGPKDGNGRPAWTRDDTTGYGRMLGRRVVIVERDCFEIGLF